MPSLRCPVNTVVVKQGNSVLIDPSRGIEAISASDAKYAS